MELNMAIIQPPQLPNNERESCVRSEFREDHYFRLHVVGVQEAEPAPNELSRGPEVSRAQMLPNGQSTNGTSHGISEKIAPKTYDNYRAVDALAQLPLGGHSLAELERETIQQTLRLNDGNRKNSAEILGISVRTLQRKLKEWSNGST